MKLSQVFAVVCAISMVDSAVHAVPIPQAAVDAATTQLTTDSIYVSQWFSDQLKYVIPFNSTSGNVVPSQLKIFGVEFGVEGVVSGTKMDIDGFHALPTRVVDTRSVDMFTRLPFPMILGHAKVGLPFGMDGGIRFGGIPKTDKEDGTTTASIKNKVVGIDVRKALITEGATKPFGLTVGLNYTHADGSIDLTTDFDAQSFTSSGQTVTMTNGRSTEHASWKTDSFGLQTIINKKILFINPYLGASVNRNTGDIDNSITTTGTAHASGYDDQTLTATGASTSKANKWDVRALAGFEFSILPLTKLGFYGEYGGKKNLAGSFGLRVQFR